MKKLLIAIALAAMSSQVYAKRIEIGDICKLDPNGIRSTVALNVDSTKDLTDSVEVNLVLVQLKCVKGKVEKVEVEAPWKKINVHEKTKEDEDNSYYSVRPSRIEKLIERKVVKFKLIFEKKFLGQSQLLNVTLGSQLKKDFLFNFVLDLNNVQSSGYKAELVDVTNVYNARKLAQIGLAFFSGKYIGMIIL